MKATKLQFLAVFLAGALLPAFIFNYHMGDAAQKIDKLEKSYLDSATSSYKIGCYNGIRFAAQEKPKELCYNDYKLFKTGLKAIMDF